MDIRGLLAQMEEDGAIAGVTRNQLAQFGRRNRRYLGPTLFPERNVTWTNSNVFLEQNVRYRTVIANAGTRYSPVQLKRGVMVGSFLVKLAESDQGSEFTGEDYDALLQYLQNGSDMQAMASLIQFLDTTVNVPLVEWNERARWQMIENAKVLLRGNNKYSEDVNYSDPAGHRANAAGTWSSDAYDPYDDIFAMKYLLASKGFTVNRIVTSERVVNILARNAKVAARTNRIIVTTGGQIQGINSSVDQADLNRINSNNGLPAFETYDLTYQTSTGSGRFMSDTVMCFFCTTGRDANFELPNGDLRTLPDTLGYVGIGRPAGQSGPGRVIVSEFFRRKPPRIENEGWQTSLPVNTEPEAMAVIKAIN